MKTTPETTILPKSTGLISEPLLKTLSYFAAFIALGMVTASLGPTLPGLAAHTQSPLGQISFLFTARSLGYLVGSFQGGRLYDRMAGHVVMAAALLLMAAMMVVVPLMSLLWVLTLVLLVLGIAEGTLDVGGNTLLVWIHGHKVGPYMNGLHFCFGVGAFLAPIIIAQAMLLSGDINWAYWVLALLIMPVGLWLLRLPSPAPQATPQESSASLNQPVLVFLIAIFFLLYVGAEAGFGGWTFTYAVAKGLANETVAAYLTSTFWGALTLGRLAAIPLATRFKPRLILLSDLVGCLLSIGLILVGSNSLITVGLGSFGLGFAMASIFPTTLSFAERRMHINGRITGWFFVGASSGGMTLPWLMGQLFESWGPQAVMIAITIDLLLALAIFAGLMVYSRNIKIKDEAGE